MGDGPAGGDQARAASSGPAASDAPAEVDAAVATQRRTAIGYGLVFLLVTGSVPVLTLVLPWWSDARLAGGLSPNFLVAAVGLYVFFLALGTAAATLATAIEDRMLGGTDPDEPM
ncbi:hypothetical protein [Nitriliruptor alkaliphilus]|uniref:hypothetical protein n=1 Tax=Nitriliruptor alkaliphilus TaxID=427918 RepID=UPI000697DCF7|nr:hypothetical protein [Nitriliruptor alkaliphilus]